MQKMELSNDERVMKAGLYGEHVKRFTYAMLVLAYLNGLARADITASVCTIGLVSLWLRRKDIALTYFYALAFSFCLDLAWVSIHGNYLHDYGKIPSEASTSIRNIIQMHKFSLGISIVQLLFKFVSLWYVYRYWYFLPARGGELADGDTAAGNFAYDYPDIEGGGGAHGSSAMGAAQVKRV